MVDIGTDPGWVSGQAVTFQGQLSPRVASYKVASGRVQLHPPSGDDIVELVVSGGVPELLLQGADLPSGTRVRLQLEGQRQLVVGVATPLGELHIREGSRPTKHLRLVHNGIAVVKVPAATDVIVNAVSRQASEIGLLEVADGRPVRVTAGSGFPSSLGALRTVNTHPVVVGVPFRLGAEISVGGRIQVTSPLPRACKVTASIVHIDAAVGAGCWIQAAEEARFSVDIAASSESHAVIEARLAHFDGNAAHISVAAEVVTVSGVLAQSTVEAVTRVSVGGGLESSRVSVSRSLPREAALVVGEGDTSIDGAELPLDLTPDSYFLGGIEWNDGDNAAAADSTVFVRGGGAIVAGRLDGTSVDSDGPVVVTGPVELAGESFAATNLRCGSLVGNVEMVSVDDVVVHWAAAISGHLRARVVAVGGALESWETGVGAVEAQAIWLESPVENVALEWREWARLIQGPIGSAVMVEGAGAWSADKALRAVGETMSVDLDAALGDVTVPTGSKLRVTMRPGAAITGLRIDGHAILECAELAPVAVSLVDDDAHVEVDGLLGAELTDGASLRLLAHLPTGAHYLDVAFESHQQSSAEPEAGRDASGRGAAGSHVSLAAVGPSVQVALTCPTEWPSPAGAIARLRGPVHVEFKGALSRLTADRSPPGVGPTNAPVLTISDRDSRITEACGDLGIAREMVGWVHGPVKKAALDHSALRITALWLDQESTSGGALIDIDPTGLGYADLEGLGRLQVVDATPQALRKYAMRAAENSGQAERAELRARSEWMTRFIASTKDRAASGSSRAAARWAANRLHHRSLPDGAEKLARWLHRMLGYSNKPWPPLVTWIVVTAAVVVTRIWTWKASYQPVAVWRAIQNAVLMPLSLARLGDPIHMFATPAVNTAAFIATAIPLAFFLIAVRNVLREPGERG